MFCYWSRSDPALYLPPITTPSLRRVWRCRCKYRVALPHSGVERSGDLVKYSLNCLNASSHSLFLNFFVFLRRSWKDKLHLSKDLLINRLSVAAIPVSFYTSFTFFRLTRSFIFIICFWFTSIPWWVTKCCKNLSELTPKAHLIVFSLNLCYFNILNTSARSLKWSNPFLLLTTMSAM